MTMKGYKDEICVMLRKNKCFFSWEVDEDDDCIYISSLGNNMYFIHLAKALESADNFITIYSDVMNKRSLVLKAHNWETAYNKLKKHFQEEE